MKSSNLLLIGAGKMAENYAKILFALGQQFVVIGRGKYSAKRFENNTGYKVATGGLENNKKKVTPKSVVIVAADVDQLYNITKKLLNIGVKRILLEKPGCINLKEIKLINSLAKKKKAKILIAYNRRFYESVNKIKELSVKDGGILSAHFEFTEKTYLIRKLKVKKKIKENWLVVNSSHVIDLVFYLCGKPKKINCFSKGKLSWHRRSSIFCGSGITKKNILFSYCSNWNSPGSWNIELMTPKCRYLLKPMEKLKLIKFPNLNEKIIKVSSSTEDKFKAGLYNQVKSFLKKNDSSFCSLKEQEENFKIFNKIANYS